MTMTLPSTIISRIAPSPSGCWQWTGAINHNGYGHVYLDGTTRRAHRATYELLRGEIPAGMEIHHVCENRSCVNPAHMVVGSALFNVNEKASVNKTHCVHGHELTEANTRVQVDDAGHIHRSCKQCNRLRKRAASASWPSRKRTAS